MGVTGPGCDACNWTGCVPFGEDDAGMPIRAMRPCDACSPLIQSWIGEGEKVAEKYEAVLVYEVPYEVVEALQRGESVWLTGTRLHAPGEEVGVFGNQQARWGGIVEESKRVVEGDAVYGEIKLVGWSDAKG